MNREFPASPAVAREMAAHVRRSTDLAFAALVREAVPPPPNSELETLAARADAARRAHAARELERERDAIEQARFEAECAREASGEQFED